MQSFIDAGDFVLSDDGEFMVLLKGKTETRVIHVIDAVLESFRQMGASEEEIKEEVTKLVTDPNYFSTWCRHLPNWCPDLAYYIRYQD